MTTTPAQTAAPNHAPAEAFTPPSGQVWIDGALVPAAQASVSVFDHGVLYGDGVFEGIRAYHGRVLKLESHLKRLEESARAIRLDIPYSLPQLDAAVRQTLEV
ncbi:MAG: aminotransferase class IV, partial [Planctomycetota bacterium]